MSRKIPQDVRERQLKDLAGADGYSFVGWVDDYKDAHSKAIISCTHHGEWNVSVSSFVHSNSRCKRCSDDFLSSLREIPQDVRERQLKDLGEIGGFMFVGWVNGYKGTDSKAIMLCAGHGEWVTSVNNFINHGRRCPVCAGVKRICQNVREQQLVELGEADGYEFVGWVGKYKNRYTKATMCCAAHGEWEVTCKSFITLGARCPSCGRTGYQPAKSGTLYALLSECESMIKIGISNRVVRRHSILTRKTPFKFSIYRQLHCEDGAQPRMLERMFHDEFPSVGLRGFDGATEWRRMSPDVTTWFDLLGAQ